MDMRIHNCEVTKLQTRYLGRYSVSSCLATTVCVCTNNTGTAVYRFHVSDLTLHWFLLSAPAYFPFPFCRCNMWPLTFSSRSTPSSHTSRCWCSGFVHFLAGSTHVNNYVCDTVHVHHILVCVCVCVPRPFRKVLLLLLTMSRGRKVVKGSPRQLRAPR